MEDCRKPGIYQGRNVARLKYSKAGNYQGRNVANQKGSQTLGYQARKVSSKKIASQEGNNEFRRQRGSKITK